MKKKNRVIASTFAMAGIIAHVLHGSHQKTGDPLTMTPPTVSAIPNPAKQNANQPTSSTLTSTPPQTGGPLIMTTPEPVASPIQPTEPTSQAITPIDPLQSIQELSKKIEEITNATKEEIDKINKMNPKDLETKKQDLLRDQSSKAVSLVDTYKLLNAVDNTNLAEDRNFYLKVNDQNKKPDIDALNSQIKTLFDRAAELKHITTLLHYIEEKLKQK